MQYLTENQLIPHEHHGGVLGNTTTTAIATMIDIWAHALEDNEEIAVIILDQTAAYDLISHEILLRKMEILDFDHHALNYFKNYLKNRTQQTTLDGAISEELHTGPLSVIQGSVLSCLMFLIYTLDIPVFFTETMVKIENYTQDQNPKPTTFIDDVVVNIHLDTKQTDAQKQSYLDSRMDLIENYMAANKLMLNRDKSKLLVITNNTTTRDNMYLTAQPDNIAPSRNFTYLGMEISDNCRWNYHIEISKKNLISTLKREL